jgi:hypothetical protein
MWRSPFSCSIEQIYIKKLGSGIPTLNLRRSGSTGYAYHTASNISISTSDIWISPTSINNNIYIAGQSLEIIFTGSNVSQIFVQADFKRT